MATLISNIREAGSNAQAKGMVVLDNQIPPQRRRELQDQVQLWANENPKLAAFVAVQLAFTGIPVLFFLGFAATIFLVSVTTCLVIGLSLAFVFTAFCVGGALLILLPTIFLTTVAATFLYLWGLVSYVVFLRLSRDDRVVRNVKTAHAKINNATDGRLELVAASPEDRQTALDAMRIKKEADATTNEVAAET